MSPRTGAVNIKDIAITASELKEVMDPNRLRNIQEIVPHLSASEREFLMTGYTEEDWNEMFQEED